MSRLDCTNIALCRTKVYHVRDNNFAIFVNFYSSNYFWWQINRLHLKPIKLKFSHLNYSRYVFKRVLHILSFLCTTYKRFDFAFCIKYYVLLKYEILFGQFHSNFTRVIHKGDTGVAILRRKKIYNGTIVLQVSLHVTYIDKYPE